MLNLRRILMGFFPLLGFLSQLSKIADFTWFYFLRPSNGYKKYQRGPQPYAVIAGATDGTGKSLAKDLYRKGFNVIVHGRNEQKLKATVEEIKGLRKAGVVKSFIADPTSANVDYAGIARRFDDLNITLFINDVNETYLESKRFEEWSEDYHLSLLRRNVVFPNFLTRAFLPSLRETSRSHPVLVVLNGLSSLSAKERFTSRESNIEFMYLHMGYAQPHVITKPSDITAQIVRTFGSGREDVVPCAGDKIQPMVTEGLPGYVQLEVLKGEAEKLFKKSKRE